MQPYPADFSKPEQKGETSGLGAPSAAFDQVVGSVTRETAANRRCSAPSTLSLPDANRRVSSPRDGATAAKSKQGVPRFTKRTTARSWAREWCDSSHSGAESWSRVARRRG